MHSWPPMVRAGSENGLAALAKLLSSRATWQPDLHHHGALLYRGFAVDTVADFQLLLSALRLPLGHYIGGDSPRRQVQGAVFTSTEYPAHLNISMHHEMSFSQDYPDYLFFYCHHPAEQGGETPLVDGRQLLQCLDETVVTTFRDKRLKYIMNLHGGHGVGKSWQDSFATDDPEAVNRVLTKRGAAYQWEPRHQSLRATEVVCPILTHPETQAQVFFSQADQWHPSNLDPQTRQALGAFKREDEFYHYCCFADDTPLDEAMLEHIRTVTESLKVTFSWQAGDVLLLDNRLTMHGRHAFTGERAVYVAMA